MIFDTKLSICTLRRVRSVACRRLTVGAAAAVGLFGALGCERLTTLPPKAPPPIEFIAAPVIPAPDRVPALETEVKRLRTRIDEQTRIRGRIALATARVNRLFRADHVSRTRTDVLNALDAGLASLPEVGLMEVGGVDNRWTVLTRVSVRSKEDAWGIATQFAEQVSRQLPSPPPIEIARHAESGPQDYVLGFLHPRSLSADADALGRNALDALGQDPGGPTEPPPPSPVAPPGDLEPAVEEPAGANDPIPFAPAGALPLDAPGLPGDAPSVSPTAEPLPTAEPTGFPADPIDEEALPTAPPPATEFGVLRSSPVAGRPSRETLVPVEPFVAVSEDRDPVRPNDDPNKSERERTLEAEITSLEDRLDERALLEERQLLAQIEQRLADIETKRLPATRDREFRVEVSDLRNVAEQASLRNVTIDDHGPYRYLGLPARWYTISADGELPATREALTVFDAVGGLVGELQLTRNSDDVLHLRVYVFVLSR